MLFYLSLFAFFALLLLFLYRYRTFVVAYLPSSMISRFPSLNNYSRLSTWVDQMNVGMNSSTFDIEGNLRDGDSREGLDEAGTREVMEIMRRERVGFDQARLIRHSQILARNGVDPTGMPLDSKAITHL